MRHNGIKVLEMRYLSSIRLRKKYFDFLFFLVQKLALENQFLNFARRSSSLKFFWTYVTNLATQSSVRKESSHIVSFAVYRKGCLDSVNLFQMPPSIGVYVRLSVRSLNSFWMCPCISQRGCLSVCQSIHPLAHSSVTFLDGSNHLYMKLCPSVRPSIHWGASLK